MNSEEEKLGMNLEEGQGQPQMKKLPSDGTVEKGQLAPDMRKLPKPAQVPQPTPAPPPPVQEPPAEPSTKE